MSGSRANDLRRAALTVILLGAGGLPLGAALLGGVVPSRALADAVPKAAKPVPRDEPEWRKRHEELVALAASGKVQVAFLGDSLTDGWRVGRGKAIFEKRFAPLGAAPFGIVSDRTQHLLWRIRDGEVSREKPPRAFVLMIGTNNATGDAPKDVAAGIAAILAELRERAPSAKGLLLGLLPFREKATDPAREKVRAINALLPPLVDGKRVRYLDCGARFVEADGSISKAIMPDFLHLSAEGATRLADAIEPELKALLE